ncbi:MAG TPA: PAS domain-containing protein [Falsiroseomonas sp.]|jgi:PAS domain S-box-containing protein|nr:PAS domain-containing protein [Falsiroseomonas sp.]
MSFDRRHPAAPAELRPATASDARVKRLLGLRAHLVALVLAVLLPAFAFGGAAAWEALRRQEALTEGRLQDTAQALAAAVDRQIDGHVGALRALAAAPEADLLNNLEHFRTHAQATAEVFGTWVVLYRRDGSQLLNTRLPPDAPLPGPGGAGGAGGGGVAIARAFDTGRPVVSDIAIGRISRRPTAFVFVPVMRGGEAQAVVGMPLRPRQFSDTLRGQAAQGRGAVALTDSRGVFAAHSRGPERVVGQPRPPRADGPVGESGVLRGRSVPEDEPIRTAYHALSSATGWHVWVNEPEASFTAAQRGPLLALAGGAALALLAGLAGGAVVTRRMLRPVEALVQRAEAVAASVIGPSDTPPAPRARVAEFERLARAVTGAEAALRRVQRIGRVGGFEVDLRHGSQLRSMRSSEYLELHDIPSPQAVERHADWVARLHPADRVRAERHFLDAVADGAPDADYEQEYRILLPDGEVRWIYARGEIERDAAGRTLRMVGAHMDVTALKSAEDALRDSEERLRLALEAAQLGAWEVDLQTGTAQRLPRALEIFGYGPDGNVAPYPSWRDRVHPEDRQQLADAVDSVRSGRSSGYQIEYRFLRPDGRWIWVESHARAARHDPLTGTPTRLIGTTLDITERKAAEERQAVLVHELDHRAKNTLAVVQAALRLTPRHDVEAYARAVEGRVAALSRAHTLLAKGHWRGADLRIVAEEALVPFRAADGAGPVATLHGPPLPLTPTAVQALSMTLHELATNAAKHGALSVPHGRLQLTWEIIDGMLRICWTEADGPAVTLPPARHGFGSSLITATVTRQLGGKASADWREGGLIWEARVPLDRLVPGHEPVAPPVAADDPLSEWQALRRDPAA